MSAQWDSQSLLQPITVDQPCGENLEDTPLLASFDSFRLFGRQMSLDTVPPKREGEPEVALPDWNEIKRQAIDALGRSKDLRVLAHLGAALIRTDGLPAFTETIQVASRWLETYWTTTYPLVDEDAIVRRNALNCFADRMAVIEGVRRVPLVSNRQIGRFSLRDAEIVAGQVTPSEKDPRPDQKQIDAAFLAMPLDELKALHQGVLDSIAALKRIDEQMRHEGGPEAAPTFDPLSAQLSKADKLLRAQLAMRPGAVTDAETIEEATEGGGPARPNLKAIASREDAIRALDAVADFFRRAEPSSPVPLLVDRAKRLVSKNFLEVLEDMAPGGLDQARAVGGVREGE
jgi:type VI secretion system protein ImpA